jgi:hypothetical protein
MSDTREQFAELAHTLATGNPQELPRTWGFEIETPEADKIYNQTTREEFSVLNFTHDQSVKTDEGNNSECECCCRACNYHECNCDNCDDYNEDPEHDCGSSDCRSCGQYQEITSIGGLDTTHPEALELLGQKRLDLCSVNDTCGLHIHLASADLDPYQVANVIRTYRLASEVLSEIAGRRGVYYANDNTDLDISKANIGEGTEKYKAVNTAPHFNSSGLGRPQTIEFRQHEGTNDVAVVRAWAYLLIKLVEFGKSGKDLYWIARAKDLNELLAVIR